MNGSKMLQRWSAKLVTGFWRNKDGLGTLEIVLICAVIIAVALLFKGEITRILKNLFTKVESGSNGVFSSDAP